MQQEMVREAVGVFDNIEALNHAVAELETTAFPRHDISVLGGKPEEAFQGAQSWPTPLPEDSPDAPRTILIRPEEKTIGAAVLVGGGIYAGGVTAMLAAGNVSLGPLLGILALGGIAGGLIGAGVAWLLGHYYNNALRDRIDKGKMVLWVRTPGPRREKLACHIMTKHGGRRVHIHEIS